MRVTNHSVIIATCGRTELLARAVTSVTKQTLRPGRVVIVADYCEVDLSDLNDLADSADLTLEILTNRRTKGASGAWNTALDHLTRSDPTPQYHLVSVLDDDDWWGNSYLNEVVQTAVAGADVVASAVVRIDATSPAGRLRRPPGGFVPRIFWPETPAFRAQTYPCGYQRS